MITKIAKKEFIEMWRDGRFRVAAAIVFGLLLVALFVGAKHYRDVSTQREAAQRETREQWLRQPPKNPHTAAHYGIYAFKPVLLPSLVDNGIDPFTGVAAFLEAHKQNDFKFRPAQDATIAQRFGELTAANVLQLLVPLLIILLCFAAFAGERESGTLRQVLSLGVKPRDLAWGKASGIALGLGALLVPATIIGVVALALASADSLAANLPRLILMTLSYLLYFAVFVCLALTVSAFAKTSRSALIILLGFWIFNCLVMPRIAADIVKRVAPTPSTYGFAKEVQNDFEKGVDGHNPADKRTQELKAKVLEQYGVSRTEDLPVSFAGIALTEGETYSSEINAKHIERVWGTFERQNLFRQMLGVFAPLLPARSLSMSFAGTDFAQQRDFAAAAERYRLEFVQLLNKDMVENAGKKDYQYIASTDLWKKIPDFSYSAPSAGQILSRQLLSIAILLAWFVASLSALVFAVRRLRTE